MRIDWPSGRPRMRAFLGTNQKVASMMTDFIIANTPRGHTVYFVTASAYSFEHENMKERLKSFGMIFEERIDSIAEVTVGIFRRHKVEKRRHFIFGSTSDKDVIAAIFDSYKLAWYGEGWPFVFFVAREEPQGWKQIIDVVSEGESIPAGLVAQSHCIMQNEFEHGIFIASSEVTREQVEETAREISLHLSLYLTTRSKTRAYS